MRHLLRLELKKFSLKSKVITMFCSILFCVVFLSISLIDSAQDPSQTKDTIQSTMVAESLLLTTISIIYAAVLTSSIIIKEYNNKTILILFSYPIDRKKLMLSKLFLIAAFTVISLIIGHLICFSYLVWIDKKFDWMDGTFDIQVIKTSLKMILNNIVCCGILSIVPFIVGMIKKSVSMAVVSSVVIIFIHQVLISYGTTYAESFLEIIIMIVIVMAALFYTLKYKINEIE